jgi:cobalt-zinc-cadmium efflux system membrane fusion protein
MDAAKPPRVQPQKLPARVQYLVVTAAAAIAGVGIAVTAVASMLSNPIEAVSAKPDPSTFRPTPQEYANLEIRPAGQATVGEGVVTATGTIEVDEDHSTPVLSPYSGQVLRVLVEQGQHVARNQPLLSIRASEFAEGRQALLAAEAQRRTAAAQARIAESTAQRQAELYKSGGGALKDYQQAQSDLVAAHGMLNAARAALVAARDKLAVLGKSPSEIARLQNGSGSGRAETILRSPIGGVIAARAVANGQYVGAGGDKPLFVVTDPASVWLVAQIAESDAAHVHPGDSIEVTTPAWPGRRFIARIARVGAALDPETHRLPIRATVANPDGALKPEMFASFVIRHRGKDEAGVLLIPASAVISEGDTALVWVPGPNHVLRARMITVGERRNGMVRVLAGLKPGEPIVTRGALFVNEAGSVG